MSEQPPEKPKAKSRTLADGDIKTGRALGRRAFILGAFGGTTALAGCVSSGLTDADSGAYADPAGGGRGMRPAGVTDADSGRYADPAGRGRGTPRYSTGITDRDTGPRADPAGGGRRRGGVTDADTGRYADPAGRGRG